MADKKKKSVLDSFMKTPGASSLKEAADLLSQTIDQPDDGLNVQSNNRTDSQTFEKQKKTEEVESSADKQKNLYGQVTEQMTDQLTRHITNQISIHKTDTEQVYFLNENEALLYAALKRNVGCFTTVKRIAGVLGKSEHTLRKCLKRLVKMGLVRYERDNLRNQQGIRIVDVIKAEVRVLGDKSKVDRMIKKANIEEIAFDKK